MMDEMSVRKKMLEELMGQMDDRQMGRIQPQGLPPGAQPGPGPMAARMAGERGNLSNADIEAMGDPGEEDELTRRLRQASMSQ